MSKGMKRSNSCGKYGHDLKRRNHVALVAHELTLDSVCTCTNKVINLEESEKC